MINTGPPPPPPPPPIPLKFYGFTGNKSGPKQVFLSKGEDIFVAKEGQIIDRRYRILKIGPNFGGSRRRADQQSPDASAGREISVDIEQYAAGRFQSGGRDGRRRASTWCPGRGPEIARRRRQRDSGAMLLAVLFMMAMMVIVAMAMAPRFVQQAKRDREEEMIHRGTEYARAIKKYYKKFGRYPANLEQLENTNQIRFLRALQGPVDQGRRVEDCCTMATSQAIAGG